eukprot:scaffold4199_cov101-Cylindrotheca_fusiformis.AAC.2
MSRRSQSMDDEVEKEEGNIHAGALAIDRWKEGQLNIRNGKVKSVNQKNPQKKFHLCFTEREATKKRTLRSNCNMERESFFLVAIVEGGTGSYQEDTENGKVER